MFPKCPSWAQWNENAKKMIHNDTVGCVNVVA